MAKSEYTNVLIFSFLRYMAWFNSFVILLSLISTIFLLEYYVMVPVFVTPVWNRALSSNSTHLRQQTMCIYPEFLSNRLKRRTSRSIYCDNRDFQRTFARKDVGEFGLLAV